jgi:hypothetical protein
MGAAAWDYFVPYEANIQAALEKLRQREFRAGRYRGSEENLATIEEVLENMDADGTGSILDMMRVAEEPDYFAVAPMPSEKQIELSGPSGLDLTSPRVIESAEDPLYHFFICCLFRRAAQFLGCDRSLVDGLEPFGGAGAALIVDVQLTRSGQRRQSRQAVFEAAWQHHLVAARLHLVEAEIVEIRRCARDGVAAQAARQQHPRAGLVETGEMHRPDIFVVLGEGYGGEDVVDALGHERAVVAKGEAGILTIDGPRFIESQFAGAE